MRLSVSAILTLGFLTFAAQAAEVEKGTVRFEPAGDQKGIPERYRLAEHTFDWEMSPKLRLSGGGVEVFTVRYPSPITSPYPENNTVHCEYYRPTGAGPFPGVVVLDITGGNQDLSRIISTHLAQNRIAALFMQMPYYGPRRPPGKNVKLLSTNIPQTFEAIRQTVLDVRQSVAWLESRPEVDKKRIGIHGTSLGSFIAALSAEMEPKLGRVSILLSGGGFIDGYCDHPLAKRYRDTYEKVGGSKEALKKSIAPVDPITYADKLKGRKVLMICGERDEIVPPSMAKAMWKACGEPKIVWYDCTHYGAAVYFAPALRNVVEHFTAD